MDFWRFPDFKRGKDSVSSPIPSMQCCATVRATLENKKHPNFEWRGPGMGVDSSVSEVTLFEYNVSTTLSLIVWIAEGLHILKKIKSTHVFMLGCKTPVGFLFAMFKVVMPIWERLEYGDFVIFSAWHFVSHLSCLDVVRCGASRTISILSFIETKYKVNRTENKKDF